MKLGKQKALLYCGVISCPDIALKLLATGLAVICKCHSGHSFGFLVQVASHQNGICTPTKIPPLETLLTHEVYQQPFQHNFYWRTKQIFWPKSNPNRSVSGLQNKMQTRFALGLNDLPTLCTPICTQDTKIYKKVTTLNTDECLPLRAHNFAGDNSWLRPSWQETICLRWRN